MNSTPHILHLQLHIHHHQLTNPNKSSFQNTNPYTNQENSSSSKNFQLKPILQLLFPFESFEKWIYKLRKILQQLPRISN
jgi:hypothetical protein